jgi:hypothetical protein
MILDKGIWHHGPVSTDFGMAFSPLAELLFQRFSQLLIGALV